MDRLNLLSQLKSKGLIDGFSDDTVWAVREAILNLLELVDATAEADGDVIRDKYREEAMTTVLMLAIAVMIADGKYIAGEDLFIRHLVDMDRNPDWGGSDLNEIFSKWMSASTKVPEFFRAATRSGTAQAMLREIQFIGNNVSICDGEFQGAEREEVAKYVGILENFNEQASIVVSNSG